MAAAAETAIDTDDDQPVSAEPGGKLDKIEFGLGLLWGSSRSKIISECVERVRQNRCLSKCNWPACEGFQFCVATPLSCDVLDEHIRKHSLTAVYRCAICKRKAKNLQQHYQLHYPYHPKKRASELRKVRENALRRIIEICFPPVQPTPATSGAAGASRIPAATSLQTAIRSQRNVSEGKLKEKSGTLTGVLTGRDPLASRLVMGDYSDMDTTIPRRYFAALRRIRERAVSYRDPLFCQISGDCRFQANRPVGGLYFRTFESHILKHLNRPVYRCGVCEVQLRDIMSHFRWRHNKEHAVSYEDLRLKSETELCEMIAVCFPEPSKENLSL